MAEVVAKRRDRVVKRHRDRLYERETNDWYVEPAFCWQRLFELVDQVQGEVSTPSPDVVLQMIQDRIDRIPHPS